MMSAVKIFTPRLSANSFASLSTFTSNAKIVAYLQYQEDRLYNKWKLSELSIVLIGHANVQNFIFFLIPSNQLAVEQPIRLRQSVGKPIRVCCTSYIGNFQYIRR